MRFLLFAVVAVCLCGCNPIREDLNEHGHLIESTDKLCTRGGGLEIVELEGHEYVLFRYFRGCGITHRRKIKRMLKPFFERTASM